MDVLSRNLVNCALFGTLCLVSVPAFAVLDIPNYSWRLGQSGNVYKVYDPQGPHLSTNIDPSSTFLENSASNGVIENITPGPLTIDGATGEILNGVGLSRGLTVGDLIDSATALIVPDSPAGLALLAAGLIGTLALDAWNAANPTVSSSYPSGTSPSCGPSYYYPYGCYDPNTSSFLYDEPVSSPGPSGASCGSSPDYISYANPSNDGSGPLASQCPGGSQSGTYVPPSSTSTPETPAQALQWAQSNPSSFGTNLAPILNNSTVDQLGLARSLGKRNAPLSTPVPYGYNIPSTDATVTGSPTTTTSTDPSTGNTTNTTSTPSYKFSTPTPPNGVQVQKSITTVTQTCTSSGSCTTTNTTTQTAAATQPKLGSFTSPTLSAPTSSVLAPTPYALNLNMPSQSSAVCPSPLAYNAFGTAFTIPLSPLCTLATDVRPYVESLGAVGAGIVIFR
ncbi:hypothetical protein [Acidithiobacillus ferriphilus]|uniref:hypothetical protein n=1 Tax=Acidithiobacillus ferriphilus TaxID=1689834 RepID=UPI00232F0C4C|nr:hypothetical protein [Acidithiobacillus ferriphilus]WCE92695.1 hypothetical protein PJU76_06915 [Acidithiobacillus ferriphilus]